MIFLRLSRRTDACPESRVVTLLAPSRPSFSPTTSSIVDQRMDPPFPARMFRSAVFFRKRRETSSIFLPSPWPPPSTVTSSSRRPSSACCLEVWRKSCPMAPGFVVTSTFCLSVRKLKSF